MKIEDLLEDIKKRGKEIADNHENVDLLGVKHWKSVKDKEIYHVDVEYELKHDKTVLAIIFDKPLKDIAAIKPNVGFDFDLEYYTDEHIKYTVNDVFSKYQSWLNTLDYDYEYYNSKKEDDNNSYLR